MLENVQAVTFPIYAGLSMPALEKPDDFEGALRRVHKRGGTDASFFGGISDANWDVFERVWSERAALGRRVHTDSMTSVERLIPHSLVRVKDHLLDLVVGYRFVEREGTPVSIVREGSRK